MESNPRLSENLAALMRKSFSIFTSHSTSTNKALMNLFQPQEVLYKKNADHCFYRKFFAA